MSDLSGSEIIRVVDCMIGATEAYGDSYIDHDRLNNQKKLEELAKHILDRIYENVHFSYRVEHSMKKIGEDAKEFFGYIVEEYGLDRYAEGGTESQ